MRDLRRDPSRAALRHESLCCIVAAAVTAAATVGGAVISSNGQKKAAKATAGAANDANATQRYIFDTQRADSMPWHDAGVTGLNNLLAASTPGNEMNWLSQQPGYQFQLNQGLNAVTSNKAAGGLLGSGGTLKALQDRGNGIAAQSFGDYWNRQAGLAGVGQTANSQMNAAGQNYANQVGNNLMNAGAARASAYQQNGNAWGSALSGLGGVAANAYQGYQASPWSNPAAFAQPNGIPSGYEGLL